MARITRVLVANRADVASRVFDTCENLGIDTVAVFSEADAALPFVRQADRAVCIGPPAADRSYLDIAAVLAAAERTGADAIHPGWGFLAENALFAQAVIDAGLAWIGPPPAAMVAMASKAKAREIAVAEGLPVAEAWTGEGDPAAWAERVGLPVLVKAVAGGGGRGMRRVDALTELADAMASAAREAAASFGDPTVILERFVERPRHIEIQIVADEHGHVIHLGERECSIQRRWQKVVEEAPSAAVDEALRAEMGDAAVRLARSVGYTGVGTVEFLLGADGRFVFLEMNTRLQVEHRVTELVVGLDLVELQIAVEQGDVELDGHAIEVRLCAEDPNRDFLPSAGVIERFDSGDRFLMAESGYQPGDAVGVHYDSMLARLLVWGPDREAANRELRSALRRLWVPGLVTNLPLLRDIVANGAWEEGALHTGFLAEQGLPVAPPLNPERGALAGTVLGWWERRDQRPIPGLAGGWRVDGSALQRDAWQCFGDAVDVAWRDDGDALSVEIDRAGEPSSHRVRVLERDGDAFRLDVDGVHQTWRIARRGDVVYAHFGDGESMVVAQPRFPVRGAGDEEPGSCVAPTPGVVAAVHVAVGDEVERGARLVTLEAMKMEHSVTAPAAGTVAQVRCDVGDTVDEGALLVRIDPADG